MMTDNRNIKVPNAHNIASTIERAIRENLEWFTVTSLLQEVWTVDDRIRYNTRNFKILEAMLLGLVDKGVLIRYEPPAEMESAIVYATKFKNGIAVHLVDTPGFNATPDDPHFGHAEVLRRVSHNVLTVVSSQLILGEWYVSIKADASTIGMFSARHFNKSQPF